MKNWYDVKTIDDVRKFAKKNPKHPVSLPWEQMLEEMDGGFEEFTMDDFYEEGAHQSAK